MRPKKYLQIVWIEWLKLSTHKTIISKTKTSDSYTPIVAGRGGVGVCMTRWSGLDGGSHQPHDPAHDKCVWCLDIITAQTLHWCNDCSPDTDIVYTTPNTILLSSWCGLSPEKRREKYGCWMMIIHWYLHIGTCHMCYIFSYSCNIIFQTSMKFTLASINEWNKHNLSIFIVIRNKCKCNLVDWTFVT